MPNIYDQVSYFLKKWFINNSAKTYEGSGYNSSLKYLEFVTLAAMHKVDFAKLKIEVLTACLFITVLDKMNEKIYYSD